MFPKARKARIDLAALGAKMVDRRTELQSVLDSADGAAAAMSEPKRSARTAHRSAPNGK